MSWMVPLALCVPFAFCLGFLSGAGAVLRRYGLTRDDKPLPRPADR